MINSKYIFLCSLIFAFSTTNVMADELETPDAETVAYYKGQLNTNIENVRTSCSSIKKDLDTIFGLAVATTVSSGVGTVASGAALTVGVIKESMDYKLDEDTYKNDPDEFLEEFNRLYDDMKSSMKTIGNVRTGLMAGATATSAVSTGTSVATSVNAKKLGEKMEQCNKAVQTLKYTLSDIQAQDFPSNTINTATADNIIANCSGFDTDNIKTLKNTMTASAVASGIGSATGLAGTITSAIANKKDNRKLGVASNILAGVTMGTSGTSTAFSANAISKAKKDSAVAEQCESSL